MTASALPTRTYFPFADRALGYNCGECGYRCCSVGAGIFPTHAEFDWLERQYPSLAMFVAEPRPAARKHLLAVVNHSPRCFFLRDSGQCEVHAAHGRERKPLLCRLFPAVGYTRVGDVLVVDLHAMCPVKLWEAGSADYQMRHDELRADIEGDLPVLVALADEPPVDETGAPRLDEAWIRYEEWLRDLVAARPDLRLFDYCAIDEWNAPGPTLTLPPAPLLAEEALRLRDAMRRLVSLLLAADEVDVDHLRSERLLLTLAPRVRLFAAKHLPAAYTAAAVRLLCPRLILALAVYLEVVAATHDTPLTPATVQDALRHGLPLFLVLAHADAVPLLREPADHRPPLAQASGSDVDRVLGFIRERNAVERATLGEIVTRLASPRRARMRVLRGLSDVLPWLEFSLAERPPCRSLTTAEGSAASASLRRSHE